MTRPKRHLPGQVVFATRRCTHRRFLLGNDSSELVGYMFGRALLSSGCVAHTAIAMSNHVHYVYTDPHGERSKFMQQFHSNLARKRNLQLNRSENFWDSREPGDCALLDVETILQKTLYTALNAVAAGLVDRVEDWTGFMILPKHWGRPMRFSRPPGCGKAMPAFVEFTPEPPPGYAHLGTEHARKLFEKKISELESKYRKKRLEGVVGTDYGNDSNRTPTATAVDHPTNKSELNPRFSCNNKRRAARALEYQRLFEIAHRACLTALKKGESSVVFTAGTLRVNRVMGMKTHQVLVGDPHLLALVLPRAAANDNSQEQRRKVMTEENDLRN